MSSHIKLKKMLISRTFINYFININNYDQMTEQAYGTHAMIEANTIGSGKLNQSSFKNNLTRRNLNILERMPARSISTSLASANLKALRLFRYICRMIPFILEKHQILHRFSPIQSKIFISNHFRQNSTMTNLTSIDQKIQMGYEMIHEAEWHFVNTGYLYKYIAKDLKILRDQGISRFEDERGAGNKKQAPSGFLKSFYQTKHEDRKERYLQ